MPGAAKLGVDLDCSSVVNVLCPQFSCECCVGQSAIRASRQHRNAARQTLLMAGFERKSAIVVHVNGYLANHTGYQQGGGRRKDGCPNRVLRCVVGGLSDDGVQGISRFVAGSTRRPCATEVR